MKSFAIFILILISSPLFAEPSSPLGCASSLQNLSELLPMVQPLRKKDKPKLETPAITEEAGKFKILSYRGGLVVAVSAEIYAQSLLPRRGRAKPVEVPALVLRTRDENFYGDPALLSRNRWNRDEFVFLQISGPRPMSGVTKAGELPSYLEDSTRVLRLRQAAMAAGDANKLVSSAYDIPLRRRSTDASLIRDLDGLDEKLAQSFEFRVANRLFVPAPAESRRALVAIGVGATEKPQPSGSEITSTNRIIFFNPRSGLRHWTFDLRKMNFGPAVEGAAAIQQSYAEGVIQRIDFSADGRKAVLRVPTPGANTFGLDFVLDLDTRRVVEARAYN